MLEKLVIKNFQCHAALEVFFDPGVTTLVGPTDAGKSAVLRALRWLCLNRPAGDAFVRDGAGRASVTLTLDGGQTVTRTKGRDANGYALGGQEFRAFGQDVPPAVRGLLNVGELNFQTQHDAPYWLGLSPGQVSRELNALVNLDAMDAALAHANARLRRAEAAADVAADRLAAARSRRDALAWVPELDAALVKLEQENYAVSLKRNRIACIATALQNWQTAQEAERNATTAALGVARAVAAGDQAAGLRQRVLALQDTLAQLEERAEQEHVAAAELAAVREELAELQAGRCPLCERGG